MSPSLQDQHGGECIPGSAQLKSIKTRQLAKEFWREQQLQPTHAFPVPGDSQHHDSECIRETSNGNHIGTVIELCIEIPVFC